MKNIVLIGFTTVIMSVSTLAQANFSFYSNEANACEYVPGQWAGRGKASHWMIGDCYYHGTGISTTVDKAGNFAVDIKVDKESGSSLCPNHQEQRFKGICRNGNVTLITDYGNLVGSFTKNTGNAKGRLDVGAGINVDVDIQFQRTK